MRVEEWKKKRGKKKIEDFSFVWTFMMLVVTSCIQKRNVEIAYLMALLMEEKMSDDIYY